MDLWAKILHNQILAGWLVKTIALHRLPYLKEREITYG